MLKSAGLAVHAPVVTEGRTALGDSFREHLFDRRNQRIDRCARDTRGRFCRRNSGAEQSFSRVNIAYANDHTLIHEQYFHRCFALCELGFQIGAVKIRRERLWSKRGETRVRREREQSKAPRVMEDGGIVIFEINRDMIVLATLEIARLEPPTAGHAEMRDYRCHRSFDEKILGAACHRSDAAERKPRADICRYWLSQTGLEYPHAHDGATYNFALELTAHVFNLGKLRHR